MKCIKNSFVQHPFLVGLAIRFLLMTILPILLDDGLLLGGVKYTDIDYDVYTDAATMINNGRSPYDRHTYRYTPFLASILAWGGQWNMRWFGRALFCVADALCGHIILLMRKEARLIGRKRDNEVNQKEVAQTNHRFIDAMWWLYNPLPINICTRGSAESFIVLLPVLLTVMIATTDSDWLTYILSFRRRSLADILIRVVTCGIIHGIGIHAKLYPIIYTPSFMAFFSRESGGSCWDEIDTKSKEECSKKKNSMMITISNFVKVWIRRILRPAPIIFLFVSMIVFVGLTITGVHIYGEEALQEGLLYHFSRVDHRHNYSIYWYGIYLARFREAIGTNSPTFLSTLSRILFIPQAILLLQCSIRIAPYDLTFAMFIQTFLFVVFNKVITGQYFTWYLCLLPLCANRILWSSGRMKLAFAMLGVSIITWLASAFCLEMKGFSVHLIVWLASLFVFGASLNILRVILLGYVKRSCIDERVKKVQ